MNKKTRLFYVIIVIISIILSSRLFYLQVAKGEYYRELSLYRSVRILEETPMRGRILDRNGVVLAESIPTYELVIIPEDMNAREKELPLLSRFIGMSVEEIEEILEQSGLPDYEEVKVKGSLTQEEVIKIEEHNYELPGIKVVLSSQRYYPFGEVGANFIGFIGAVTKEDLQSDSFYNYNDIVGKQGIERQYEIALRGEKGKKEVLVDVMGRVKEVIYEEPSVMGHDIYLSIDINVQKELEKIIGDEDGVAIAMDPANGEIIAMVSHPTFDPNLFVKGISESDYQKLLSKQVFINRATQSSYPPGSTFKPLTLIAALSSNTIKPQTTVYCGNSVKIGGRVFKDWIYPAAFGLQTPAVALANSSDVFFYTIGTKTGIEEIDKYASMFKITEPTGVDIPYETGGLLPTPEWKKDTYNESWYIGDTANISIGQGYLLVTPLEMAAFYSLIANEGVQYTPHFMLKIVSQDGKIVQEYGKKERLRVEMSEEVIKTVKDGMEIFANQSDMRILRVNNTRVCAKTGTAEAGKDIVHHWLISFAPYENPDVVGLVFFEKSNFRSSHSLAPFMRDLLKMFF